MKFQKSNLRITNNEYYHRVLETDTNIYFYPLGDHKGKLLYAKKYDRKMNFLAEGLEVDNELFYIYVSGNYNWVSKKFDEKFAIFK